MTDPHLMRTSAARDARRQLEAHHDPSQRPERDERRFAELEANARHASDRYRLYRAQVQGPRATSPARLRELKREAELAERMLERAHGGQG